MLKFAVLTILSVPSILAAVSRKDMAAALIAAEDTGTLKETFKRFEKEQYVGDLSDALVDVAQVQACIPKVVACLRMAYDPFPRRQDVCEHLVHRTLTEISESTDTESFTNVITSFKPSDAKLSYIYSLLDPSKR